MSPVTSKSSNTRRSTTKIGRQTTTIRRKGRFKTRFKDATKKQSKRSCCGSYGFNWTSISSVLGGIIVILLAGVNIRCLLGDVDRGACNFYFFKNSTTYFGAGAIAKEDGFDMLSQLQAFILPSNNSNNYLSKNNDNDDDIGLYQKERVISHLSKMLQVYNLTRSAQHQKKFHLRKQLLDSYFNQSQLYPTETGNFAAIPMNDEYAYIHVWKCGGTTMELQTKLEQTSLDNLTQPYYITFVRDPIEHFLSGFGECGLREKTILKKDRLTHRFPNPKRHYDRMIMEWINYTKATILTQSGCMKHSFPQANYLMRKENGDHNSLFPELVLIAELNELGGILQHIIELPTYNNSLQAGRNSSGLKYKQDHFPSRIDWMSNDTLKAVCEFVAIDYFLFDYEPPEPCRHILHHREKK